MYNKGLYYLPGTGPTPYNTSIEFFYRHALAGTKEQFTDAESAPGKAEIWHISGTYTNSKAYAVASDHKCQQIRIR